MGGFLIQEDKKMIRTVTLTLLAGLVLCVVNSGLADDYTPYYVATGGDDSNTCTQPNQPCKSIRAALNRTSAGKSHIHIARGTYAESSTINITAGKNILFSGGWNSDFAGQQCQPGNTIITPAGSPSNTLLFRSNIDGAGQEATVDLRCLTLTGNGVADSKAIYGVAHNGAKFTVNIEQTLIAGWTGGVLYFETSGNGSSGTVIMRDSTVADNPGHSNYSPRILEVSTFGSSSLDLDLDRVRFVNNGAAQTSSELYGYASDSGQLDIQVKNCLFSHRYPSVYPVIFTTSVDSGTLNFTLLNSTATTLQTSNPWVLEAYASHTSTSTLRLTNTLLTGATGSGGTTIIYQRQSAVIDVLANYSILGTHDIDAVDQDKVTWKSYHEVTGDPRLDTTGHLENGSVAIDAGICGETIHWPGSPPFYLRIAPYDDMDGAPRPGFGQLWGCDIGADEYPAFPWPMFLPAITHE